MALRPLRPIATLATALLLVACVVLALVTFGVVTGRWQAAPVLTGSMEPALPTGSLLVARSQPRADLVVGDVLVFHAPTAGRPVVVHRIVELDQLDGATSVVTRGDANEEVDPWGAFELRSPRVWTVSRAIPGLGRLVLAVRSPAMQLLAMIMLAVACGALYAGRLRRPAGPSDAPEPADVPAAQPASLAPPPTAMTTPRAASVLLPPTAPAPSPAPTAMLAPPASAPHAPGVEVAIGSAGEIDLRIRIHVTSAGETRVIDLEQGVPAPEPVAVPTGPVVERRRPSVLKAVAPALLVGMVAGAPGANAALGDREVDEVVVSTGSVSAPTSLDVTASVVGDVCQVAVAWTPTSSPRSTGHEVLRQRVDAAVDEPFTVVAAVDASTTSLADVVDPAAYRYAVRSTQGPWASPLTPAAEVDATVACEAATKDKTNSGNAYGRT